MICGSLSKGLGLLAALALSQTVDAAILPRQNNEALRPWVTVAADGAAKTVTPTINDGKTTSAFPGSTTLPTADAQGAGTFLLCNQAAGASGLNQPFCSPKANSELEGGKTYWGEHDLQLPFRPHTVTNKTAVTWDTAVFPAPSTMIQVQGDYGVTDTIEAGHGFTSLATPASQGHFAWAAVGYNMAPNESLDVQLFMAILANNGSISGRHAGPKVRIVNRSPSNQRRRGPNVFGIVLPIVFGVLSLGGIGWFVWWYGRRKGMFSSRGRGYGVGQSRVQRTADVKIGLGDSAFSSPDRGVEMMPPPPRPPQPAEGNVFRNELNRQERNERAQTML
ncbi:uncharacterized protein ColSpa_08003 [Colletotrichum spaethianum]|uniref:Uncharacterized protein n=1 Tax=Colletotrichum spaethianum TaxID=700344 RepID=A0AA37UPX8_9PEZI|nr:uncharacterized protein ColSpa_08003 [Colletotrichum spaethianum]GKT47822.1 hypothetical protein ColSpa_08003 [Colletotrichum spaethianum]